MMNNDLRYQPLYSLAEVSRYARVFPGTLRSWTGLKEGKAIVLPASTGVLAPYSFINIVESHVLVALRRVHRVPMQRVRKAVEWMMQHCDTDHPLAELDLETDGYNVFVRELGMPVNASKIGQIGIPQVLANYLHRIERDKHHTPIRFYPLTYDASPKEVMMDPAVVYGRPVIVGTRITTVMVYDRFSGGESIATIAADYDLSITSVEEALRCERELRAA